MDNIGSIADRAVVVKEEIERINQKEWKRKSGSALNKKVPQAVQQLIEFFGW
jgi:hypothetical protein